MHSGSAPSVLGISLVLPPTGDLVEVTEVGGAWLPGCARIGRAVVESGWGSLTAGGGWVMTRQVGGGDGGGGRGVGGRESSGGGGDGG